MGVGSKIKNPKRVFSQDGFSVSTDARISNLENNVYKVTYYEIVSGASGNLSVPSQATINSDEFGLSGNALLSKIDINNKPTYESPTTSGGSFVTASLNTTTGAWAVSGAYTDLNVALIYSVNITAEYFSNLNNFYIIETISLNPKGTQTLQDVTDLGNVTTDAIGVDAVAFSLTPTSLPGQGQIAYNGATGALAYLLDASNVACQIGQQLFAYVVNDDSVTINKGQPVYLFSASGNKASVKLAANTSDSTSAKTLGLAAEDITSGQKGFVICQGVLDGLNTGSYTAGNTLYLGATAGSLTNVKPYAPNHLVYIGTVERANNGAGQIYVRPQNGYELDELHNVDLITTPPSNNDILSYESSSQLWKNTPRYNSWTDIASSCTIVGWSSFTAKEINIIDLGNTYCLIIAISGTSNSAITSVTIPYNNNGSSQYLVSHGINNGTNAAPRIEFLNSASLIKFYRATVGVDDWTPSGTKTTYATFTFKK